MQKKSSKSFQQKLDTLSELPDGFSFDAAQSWNKLEEKLTGKPKKKKVLTWLMAVASVLLLFSLLFFFKEQPTEIVTAPSDKPVIKNADEPLMKSTEQITSSQPKTQNISHPNQISKKINKQEPAETILPVSEKETIQEQVAIQTPNDTEVKPQIGINETAIIPVVTSTPVKRKIIHINELGREAFLNEQQMLSIKEEKTAPEVVTEEIQPSARPFYKKFKLSHRINNN
jgi:cytoskeletal protein RodZ